MHRISIPQARRALQIALGVVWLLAAALQFQPFMFGHGFAQEVLKPTAAGNPALVARPVLWSAGVVLAHPIVWNTLFASTQLLLGLGLFWRRSVKLALVGTVAWSVIVWWLGEGLGGVLTGSTTPLMGAPGAVILYALLALLLWPRDGKTGASLAETSIISRIAPAAWVLLWGGVAYFALLPANDSPSALHGTLAGMAGGEPGPIGSLDRWLAGLVAHSGVGPLLGALFALCALAVLVPPRLAKPLCGLAMLLAAITWIGQDFGGILTGQATDPNSGPLLFLLAIAYWPLAPQAARQPITGSAPRRPPLLRVGLAAAAATLVAASSTAAATGLTTRNATASFGPARFTATSKHTLGPGPIRGHYHVAGFSILFRDTGNRATHPGIISVRAARNGHAVKAKTRLSFHPRGMNMSGVAIPLTVTDHGYSSHQGPRVSMGGLWRISVLMAVRHGPELRLNLTDLISR